MPQQFHLFLQEEDGAITVDWVVLTALILGVQIVVLMVPIRDALVGLSAESGEVVEQYGEFLEN